MTHALCLANYSGSCIFHQTLFPTSFLHAPLVIAFVYLYLCLFRFVSLITWSELSGDTQANNTPGEEKREVVLVCENSLGVIPTAICINNAANHR